jgi:nucleotide-binding universal stress UspA family protein
MSWIHTILFPTDFSERSQAAFPLACAVARDQQARLLVLYVDPPPVAHGEVVARRQPDYTDSLWEQLHRFGAPEGMTVDYYLAEGPPVEEILRLAREEKCDLIIMPSHGHTGLARLLMGSVAEQVVRQAPCPVLTLSKPSQPATS